MVAGVMISSATPLGNSWYTKRMSGMHPASNALSRVCSKQLTDHASIGESLVNGLRPTQYERLIAPSIALIIRMARARRSEVPFGSAELGPSSMPSCASIARYKRLSPIDSPETYHRATRPKHTPFPEHHGVVRTNSSPEVSLACLCVPPSGQGLEMRWPAPQPSVRLVNRNVCKTTDVTPASFMTSATPMPSRPFAKPPGRNAYHPRVCLRLVSFRITHRSSPLLSEPATLASIVAPLAGLGHRYCESIIVIYIGEMKAALFQVRHFDNQ